MLAQVLTLLFLRRLELHNSAAAAAVPSEVFDIHATAPERPPVPSDTSVEALPATDVEGGGGGGGGGGGECFLRVHWVAVPEALRARRANRRGRRRRRGGRAGAAGGSGGRPVRYAGSGAGARAGGQAVGWRCRGARLSNLTLGTRMLEGHEAKRRGISVTDSVLIMLI
eukprot:COSAG01_NODE_1900_length_8964_cov_121.219177_3_plen_169_part_00